MTASALSYFSSALLTAVTTLTLAIFVLSRNPKSKLYRIFFLYTISISAWSFPYAFMANAPTEELALLLGHSFNFGVSFICVLFVHFVLILLEVDEAKRRKAIVPLYLTATVFTILVPTRLMVSGVRPKFGLNYFIDPGPAYYLYVLFWVGCVSFGLIKLFKGYRSSMGAKRNQLKYLFFGSLIGYIGGPANFLLVFDIRYPFYPLGTYAVPIYTAITAYAIIKYRLMDITLYATRATVFVLVTILVTASALGMTSFAKKILITKVGESWWYIPLLLSMVLASIGYALSIYVIKKMDEARLAKFQEAQEALEISGRGMIEIDSIHRLAKIIPRYLTMFYFTKLKIKISHATIFLLDSKKNQHILISSAGEERQTKGNALLLNNPLCEWFTEKRRLILENRVARPRDIDVLRIDDIDYWLQNNRFLSLGRGGGAFLRDLKREVENLRAIICVPSFFKENLLGFLLLGNKSHGMYNDEELDLFSRLATNAAAAFRSAQLAELIRNFEEEKAEAERLIATGELLNSVRHEIGNILNKISMPIQMIEKSLQKDEFEKEGNLLKTITNNVMSAKTILSYVDEYRKRSDLKVVIPHNLNMMIDDAISFSSDLIEDWNIRIFAVIDPRIMIKGKETLPDIFKHLVINACYGMEPEGGILSFSAKIIEEINTVEIIQTDTGVDLTKEIQNHATMGGELFAEQGKIGGISLFLARRIIKDHSGSLGMESNLEKGTKFIVRLPIDVTKVGI